jgi:bifunctional DNA-binding transcriptional regulator/antitoxin component of YhaV-PrlF toxin-antitoxin module
MPTVKLGKQRQITLPPATVKRLGLTIGEELEVVESDTAIMLVPRKHIPEDQQWYHTPQWQTMMEKAFEDLRTGRMLGPFESVEEFKRAIKARPHR